VLRELPLDPNQLKETLGLGKTNEKVQIGVRTLLFTNGRSEDLESLDPMHLAKIG
jgi:hypothetical protein